jgi:hypothetical protein
MASIVVQLLVYAYYLIVRESLVVQTYTQLFNFYLLCSQASDTEGTKGTKGTKDTIITGNMCGEPFVPFVPFVPSVPSVSDAY